METFKSVLSGAWARFRRWPIVAQIIVGSFLGLFAIGAAAAPFTEDPQEEQSAVEDDLPRATTTTAERPTTTEERTTTTAERTTTTTTTAPPTTLPPTTAPPPPPPPPPPSTTAAPAPAPGGGCTPGYDPCIPPASDVDCAGGSGDGPAYVSGPVTVSGSDPYDLDRDGNGTGCES